MSNMLEHEQKQVEGILEGVKMRSMLTQAATLERELDWSTRVYAELMPSPVQGGNAFRFIILRPDGTWTTIIRLRKR